MPVLYREKVLLVNAAFRDNGAALPYLPVLPRDLFFGAYPFARFVKEYAAGGNLNLRLGKQPPFAENQMDVVIGLQLLHPPTSLAGTLLPLLSSVHGYCRLTDHPH